MCSTEVLQPLLRWKSNSEAIQTQACGVLPVILPHGFAQVCCNIVFTLDVLQHNSPVPLAVQSIV